MARKRTHLRTVGHIVTELGRQYRKADAGDLPWQDAAAASRILREMRQALEGGEIERRIEALEAALAGQQHRPRRNGHDHAHRPELRP